MLPTPETEISHIELLFFQTLTRFQELLEATTTCKIVTMYVIMLVDNIQGLIFINFCLCGEGVGISETFLS
jgi:hypothetical protein